MLRDTLMAQSDARDKPRILILESLHACARTDIFALRAK